MMRNRGRDQGRYYQTDGSRHGIFKKGVQLMKNHKQVKDKWKRRGNLDKYVEDILINNRLR
jgi:hypothetical protein